MINIQITDMNIIIAFWLCFTRIMVILMQLPILDHVAIPNIVKVLTTLVLTYAFFPFVEGEILKDIHYVGEHAFWFLTVFNTVVGIIIGYFVKSIMNIFISSGALITQQVGFAAVSYFDPTAGQQIGPFEKVIQWTVLIIVISSGALLPMFKGMLGTFFSVHAYSIGKIAASPEFFLGMFKQIFIAALMLASPLIFTNMLITSILGIIARAVPQMNVIMVSFVVNIGLGLIVFVATSNEFFQVAMQMYTEQLGMWFNFVI